MPSQTDDSIGRPVVIVDTTTTFDDVMLVRTSWTQLLSLSSRGLVEVIVPLVVLRETARHWRKHAIEVVAGARTRYDKTLKANKAIKELGLTTLSPPPPLPELDIDDQRYLTNMQSRLADLHVAISPLPNVTIESVLERDLAGRPPFQSTGKGFRDALIWSTLVEISLARTEPHPVMFFVSDNASDYAEGQKLHPALLAEMNHYKAPIHYVRSLSDLLTHEVIVPLLDQLLSFRSDTSDGRADDSPSPNVSERIRDAVTTAAEQLVNEELSPYSEPPLEFEVFEIPTELDSMMVEYVDVDLPTIDWEVYETYDGGTLLARASVSANIELDAFVYKSDYYAIASQVDLSDFDWNDHMARVGKLIEARLTFQLRLEASGETVEDISLESIEPA